MYTGELMIYGGIGIVVVSFLLFIILSIVFKTKKKIIKNKIYGE